MTGTVVNLPSPPAPLSRMQVILHAWLAFALGALILGVGLWDFRQAQEVGAMRVNVLVSLVVAGVSAAFCFGGAIHWLGHAGEGLGWGWRMVFGGNARVLVVLQVVAMAVTLWAAWALLVDQPIPGPDYSVLYPGWSPPTQP